MDYLIHRWFHNILDDALLIVNLPGLRAGRTYFNAAMGNPVTKEAAQIALLGAAKFVDSACAKAPGYTRLTPLVEEAIKNGYTDF